MFLNPPKYLAARYIPERDAWQLFSGSVIVLEHWSQRQCLLYLLHFDYEEVAPGFYERQTLLVEVDFAA